jgi:hypothetical protein
MIAPIHSGTIWFIDNKFRNTGLSREMDELEKCRKSQIYYRNRRYSNK